MPTLQQLHVAQKLQLQLSRFSCDAVVELHGHKCCGCSLQLVWSWRSAATQVQWEACLAAAAQSLAAMIHEQGVPCLSQPALIAVCQLAVQPDTAPTWLKAMLGHDSTTSLKGNLMCQRRWSLAALTNWLCVYATLKASSASPVQLEFIAQADRDLGYEDTLVLLVLSKRACPPALALKPASN